MKTTPSRSHIRYIGGARKRAVYKVSHCFKAVAGGMGRGWGDGEGGRIITYKSGFEDEDRRSRHEEILERPNCSHGAPWQYGGSYLEKRTHLG